MVAAQPGDPDALHRLGLARHQRGDAKGAIALFEQALAHRPNFPEAHNNLGVVLWTEGNLDDAKAHFRTALELVEAYPEAHNNLANVLRDQGHLEEAAGHYRRALALNPTYPEAHNNLGSTLLSQGRLREAVACYRQALALYPGYTSAYSNLLLALHCGSEVDRETMFAEAKTWGLHYATLLGTGAHTPHQNVPDPERRLRIGYVSGDFLRHPVAFYLEPVLRAHDRSKVEIVCYANNVRADDMTQRLRGRADQWRNLVGLDDQAAARLIRHDSIDILVDLSGHTGANRLLVFARRPAPIQVTWLGYFDTTGLSSMNYLLADWYVCPAGDDRFYSERVVRLPGSFLCYKPPLFAPSVTPPPALKRGYVTFGCFNNLAKVTPEVVSVWTEICRRLPDAHVCLKGAALSDEKTRSRYVRLFEREGVARYRLHFLARSTHLEYLAAHGEIDVALDPFPYNGGTTTDDALWMGVPVISLRGDRFVSRMGLSHLSSAGLEEFVADSPAEYVAKAVALAGDLLRLTHLRTTLREQLTQSPLCDHRRFTQNLEAAYRDMWGRWCQTRSSGTGPTSESGVEGV